MIREHSANAEVLDRGEFIQVWRVAAVACALLMHLGGR